MSLRITLLSQSLSLKIKISISSGSLRLKDISQSHLEAWEYVSEILVSSRDDKKCLLLTSCSLLSKNLEIYFSSKFIWEKVVMWHSACLVSARRASPPRGRDCQEKRGRANRPEGWGWWGLVGVGGGWRRPDLPCSCCTTLLIAKSQSESMEWENS